MKKTPKPVDREGGEKIEAAPLLESGNGSTEPGTQRGRSRKGEVDKPGGLE